MKLRQIEGHTYVADTGFISLPFYDLGQGQVVLMDSGLTEEAPALLDALHSSGFRVRAILTSHAHFDHVGGHNQIRASDGAEIWASSFDAAAMQSTLTLQAVFGNERVEGLQQRYRYMVCAPDGVLAPGQTALAIEGAVFQVVPLPGHAHSHTCFITPDGVAYLADLMLGDGPLAGAKLLYAQCWDKALQSMEQGCKLSCKQAVLAHGELELRPCLGCNGCAAGNGCVQKDDMGQVLDALLECDVVALASPLYFWSISAQLKMVIDRLYALGRVSPRGYYEYPRKKCVLLATSADVDGHFWPFELVEQYYRRLTRYLRWTDLGILTAGGCGGTVVPRCIEKTPHLQRAYDFGRGLKLEQ